MKNMRVVFNVLSTLKPKTGVGHYAARLAAALADEAPGVTTFPDRRLTRLLGRRPSGAAPSGGVSVLRRWLGESVKRSGWHSMQALFRWRHTRDRFDLYHEPNFLPFDSPLPTVTTVHDLSVLLHPEWHPADRVRRHEQQFRRAIRRAAHVITVSEVVRRELIQHLGLRPASVTAVPNGVGQEFVEADVRDAQRVATKLQLPLRYLLYVGTIEPRKNLLTLMRAYCDLPDSSRRECPLVLAGGWGWRADPIAEYYHSRAKARGVIHLGYVDGVDLPGLYAGARALVFPSHYEGFGLPPLEMLAAGGAVLASTAAAHREVLGEAAVLIDADDAAAWRSALLRALTDEDWLESIRRGARVQATKFSWARCARETAAVYRQVCGMRAAA